MSQESLPDYYEIVQVSPRADQETVERVFRLLAKRLHPDNAETGNADRFNELLEAFRVLSNPETRAAYDVRYEASRERRWRVFDLGLNSDAGDDIRLRDAILSIMYQGRRQNPDKPGIGNIELERMLGVSEEQIRFHLWYLKEKGWTQRLENGQLAITAEGVDRVMELGGPAKNARDLLGPGRADAAGPGEPVYSSGIHANGQG
jgi:curved DNA-binding protein